MRACVRACVRRTDERTLFGLLLLRGMLDLARTPHRGSHERLVDWLVHEHFADTDVCDKHSEHRTVAVPASFAALSNANVCSV